MDTNGTKTKLVSDINTSYLELPFPGCFAYTPDGKILFGYMMVYGGHIYDYIYFIDADGDIGMLNATWNTEPELDRFFKWSPDGEKIASISDRRGSPDIWIMDSDGGDKMPLTTSKENEGPIGWSSGGFTWSSGGKIAYIVHSEKSSFIPKVGTVIEQENDIWIMDADGGNKSVLLRVPHSNGKMDASHGVPMERRWLLYFIPIMETAIFM